MARAAWVARPLKAPAQTRAPAAYQATIPKPPAIPPAPAASQPQLRRLPERRHMRLHHAKQLPERPSWLSRQLGEPVPEPRRHMAGWCLDTPGTWTPATFTPCVWTPGTWAPANHNTWNGCVMDRGNWDGPDATTSTPLPMRPIRPHWSSLYAPEQYGPCPQASRQLSDDWSALKTLVDNMSPAGNTNQAIDLQVGWQSLVGGGPFIVPGFDPVPVHPGHHPADRRIEHSGSLVHDRY
jgi:hypothetical protein